MGAVVCPRPDKEAFSSPEAARQRYLSIIHTDPNFSIYQCVCGKWHGGNHARNQKKHASHVSPTPLIRTGLNPAPEAPKVTTRRKVERHAPSAVRSLKVNPAVWRRALAAAGGDSHRIEIVDATTVKIHNTGDWRKRTA